MTRNVVSALGDDPYEEIHSVDAHTDEDASTVSVDDSAVEDDSNADTLSDFAYDSDGNRDDESDLEETLAAMCESTPLALSRAENEQLATSNLFVSTHTDATERWENDETDPSNMSAQPLTFYDVLLGHIAQLIPRFKESAAVIRALRSVVAAHGLNSLSGYVGAIVLAGVVATVIRTSLYGNVAHIMQASVSGTNAPGLGDAMSQAQPSSIPGPRDDKENTGAWTFEPLQHTRDMLNKLTNSGPNLAQLPGLQTAISDRAKTPNPPRSDRLSTPLPLPNMKDLSKRLPSSLQNRLLPDQYFVSLRHGNLVKTKANAKSPDGNLLGPLKLVKEHKANFKVHYDADDHKVRIARTEASSVDAPAHIIVSSAGKVVQRGSLNTANVLHWAPSVIPERHRHGKIRILCVQLTEASVQEIFIDLGPSPAQVATVEPYSEPETTDSSGPSPPTEAWLSLMGHAQGKFLELQQDQRISQIMSNGMQLFARAQRRVLAMKSRLSFRLEGRDAIVSQAFVNYSMDKVHACKSEATIRLKRAQGRSKVLRRLLEEKVEALGAYMQDMAEHADLSMLTMSTKRAKAMLGLA